MRCVECMACVVESRLADGLPVPLLSPLPLAPSRQQLIEWTEAVRHTSHYLARLISLHSNQFWSTVCENAEAMRLWDDVIETLPRRFDLDTWHRARCWDMETANAAVTLERCAYAFFLRIAVWNKELDPQLSVKEHCKLAKRVLPMERLAAAVAVLGDGSGGGRDRVLSTVLSRLSKEDADMGKEWTGEKERRADTVHSLTRILSSLPDAWRRADAVGTTTTAGHLETAMWTAIREMTEQGVLFSLARLAAWKADPVADSQGLAALCEAAVAVLTTSFLMDTAMAMADYPLRRFLRLRQQLTDSVCRLWLQHSEWAGSEGAGQREREKMIRRDAESDTFLYLLNCKQQLLDLIPLCRGQPRSGIESALQKACERGVNDTLTQLSAIGMMEMLGDLDEVDESIAQAVDDVIQVMPHLSEEYVHLCLRHFDYDSARCIDAIFSDGVPAWLRRVESAQIGGGATGGGAMPSLEWDWMECAGDGHVTRHELVPAKKEEKKQQSKPQPKQPFKGLFSMAPMTRAAEDMAAEKARKEEEERRLASENMEKIRMVVERLKLRAVGKDDSFIPEKVSYEYGKDLSGKGLVPMKNAKKHATVESFRVTEADKVAVRPTYEKYKMVADDDEDLYDDEYDDGYEEKAFTIEPLNEELPQQKWTPQLQAELDEAAALEAPTAGASRGPPGFVQPPRDPHTRGACGGGGTRRGGPSRGAPKSEKQAARAGEEVAPPPRRHETEYTGGRDRQQKERHKNAFKQRGADRKMRGAF